MLCSVVLHGIVWCYIVHVYAFDRNAEWIILACGSHVIVVLDPHSHPIYTSK